MAHSPPPLHGPESKRPKGILKNSHHRSPTHKPVTIEEPAAVVEEPSAVISREATPDGGESLTERDIVLKNTLKNAGRRRSSSNQSRAGPSRRHSHHESNDNTEGSPRLKWDEANLYLTEQERTPKMKIDEPKTPFAKGYDPTEDEAELRMLDVDDLIVDELEARRKVTPDVNIPDLDLGEPSAAHKLTRKESQSPKQVVVKEDDDESHHVPGDEPETPEEEEKHKKFEELRKKHYEMKNVANLLGHPEYLEEEDDDGDVELKDPGDEGTAQTNGASEVSQASGAFVNGEQTR